MFRWIFYPSLDVLFDFAQLAIMQAGEQQQGAGRAEQSQKHVPLGIPDISLGAKKGYRTVGPEYC